jgi:hypothetical protein
MREMWGSRLRGTTGDQTKGGEGGEVDSGKRGLTRCRSMDVALHDPRRQCEAAIHEPRLHPSVRLSHMSLRPPALYVILAGPRGLRCSDTVRRCPESQSHHSDSGAL